MVGFGFVTDVLLAVLLIAVIGYAVVLNRKLSILRDAKEEFENLLASFGATTEQAQSNLQALREEAGTVKESFDKDLAKMQKSLAEVHSLSDDLEYLIKRGEKLADRMAGKEAGAPVEPGRGRDEPAETHRADDGNSGAQQQFLRTLQGIR